MRLFFKNKIYHLLTVSRFLNTIGSSLYNIVFVVYAATVFHSKIMLSIANVTMVVPTLFTIWIGIKADQTQAKKEMDCYHRFHSSNYFYTLSFHNH